MDVTKLKASLVEADYRVIFQNLGLNLDSNPKGSDWISHLRLPFGKDKNPSLSVNVRNGGVKDHGSEFSGDVFTLAQAVRGGSFFDAVKWIAEITGRLHNSHVPNGKVKEGTVSDPRQAVTDNDSQSVSASKTTSHFTKPHPVNVNEKGMPIVEMLSACDMLASDSPVAESARSYLTSRVVSEDSQRHYRIGLRQHGGRSWIVFPLRTLPSGIGYKEIAFDPARKSWQLSPTSKKIVLSQGRTCIYPLKDAMSDSGTLLLCEGEICALSARAIGYNAITCTAGASTFRASEAKIIGSIPASRKGVIVAYDGDAAGTEGARKVCRELDAAGIEWELLSMPDGQDVNDLVRTNGLQRLFSDAHSRLTRRCSTSGKIVQLADFGVPEPRQWIVDGLFPERCISILFGEGGKGKSLLALRIALAVAAGETVFGRDVIKSPVLYLDAELDGDEMKSRADLIVRGIDGLDSCPSNLHYKSLREPLSSDLISSLQKEVDELGIKFIVLDSLSIASSVRDLKDGSEVIKQMKQLELLGTVLAIDHVAKSAHEGNRSLPFGSIFKTNIARSLFSLTQDNDVSTLTQIKSNFSAKTDVIRFELKFGVDCISFECIEGSDPRIIERPKQDRMAEVLAVVTEFPDSGISAKDLADLLKIKSSTASNYLSKLKSDEKVTNSGGVWYPSAIQSISVPLGLTK